MAEPAGRHYAMLGMAYVAGRFPLYSDGVNEKGLCIAAMNFPDIAYYPQEEDRQKVNLSPSEFCLWVLAKCGSVAEAKEYLEGVRLVGIPYSSQIPLAPLHWHIADQNGSVVVEPTRDGLKILDNPIGVLTNNPAFDFQMTNLCQYLNLTTGSPNNCFSETANIKPYGQGLGSFGLPGDFSPSSRFVKASYLALNSVCSPDEENSVAQLFHLLDSVSLVKGSVITQDDSCDVTTYCCCMNAQKGFYYYKTYTNNRLTAIDMARENPDGASLLTYPLVSGQQVYWANA